VTLREPTFLILTSLASGPRHGYGIIQDIADLSDGRVRLRAGTLRAIGTWTVTSVRLTFTRPSWVTG